MSSKPPAGKKPWYRVLYIQVLIAVALGVAVGYFFPKFGASLKPLGEGFVNLVKMMIAPIIFCTVVHGIASMGDLKKLGRTGAKTLLYFEVVSTLALLIGLVVVNVLKPGEGFNFDPHSAEVVADSALKKSAEYQEKGHSMSTVEFLLNIIPKSFFSAFATGDLLQVLFIAIISAFALTFMGQRGKPVLHVIEYSTEFFFGVMHILVKAAPLGAFGAMAFTVGSYGIESLNKLLALMAGFYITALCFVLIVLGAIARWAGFSIIRFLIYIKDELLLVLGTSSSETALPGMIEKMQRLGCEKSTVGLVIPTGYSFNLDGTNIYMAMAAVFLAQATNTPLDLHHQITLLLVAMLTSKGASGVTGAGFVTLAATLESVGTIPVASLALLIGIDRFMSECRAITNLIGNGVATVVISRWEKELSAETLRENMTKPVHAHVKSLKTEEEE
ncbi:sodium:dicarboxylate symporter [Verrucomicrobiaceae bacterium SCGC AG-212-N21]|nr:sodium:dicarboxylate symporter [Verrucomicrobiaceae bacterium SCGC AG-212-N21]